MKEILGTCLFNSTAVGVTLLGLTLGVRAQTPADEISPPVTDVLFGLERMMGSDSTLVETSLEGFADKYGDAVKQGDHIQGITVTASGRIVLSYSRLDPSQENCSGMLVYSSPFDPANPNKELDWDFYCETGNTDSRKGPIGPGLEGHPSTLQASGNILAVGTHGGTRFYYLGSNGIEALDPDTAKTFPVEDSGGVRRVNDKGDQIYGRDSTGLVYNHVDNRFYLLNAAGTVTPNTTSIQLCRSAQNISLRQAQSSVFNDCKIIDDVYASGQGSNLVMQEDGTLYLLSAFSTTEKPKGGGVSYGTLCNLSRASPLTPAFSDIFADQLYVTKLDYASGTATKVYNANLEKTQYDPCVHYRPSFRFGGGIATVGNGDLLGLWSGRQNPPVLALGDSFEFAFQKLPTPEVKSTPGGQPLDYKVTIDCNVSDIDDEQTTSTITATFYNKDFKQLGSGTATNADNTCNLRAQPMIAIEAELPEAAEYVKISTNGSDGFMVDTIQLYADGEKIQDYGANNDKGWCFSTDPSDGTRSWLDAAVKSTCVTHHTWSYSGNPVSGNPYDAIEAVSRPTVHAVKIDCNVDNLDNEETTSTITATFYNKALELLGSSTATNADSDCNWRAQPMITIEAKLPEAAEYVKISTNGSDGFMVDTIHLYADGEKIKEYGVNNDKGWCFSTDPSDGTRSWFDAAVDITCVTKHAWSYSGGSVPDRLSDY